MPRVAWVLLFQCERACPQHDKDEMTEKSAAAPAAGAGRVMLVEDDEAFRTTLVRSLQLAGFEVASFTDAESAVQSLALGAPDLVLTDLRLPLADGLFVLQQAKLKDADLPVLMMTGHGDIPTAIQAIRDGAYDFLEKPFGRERMISIASRAVNQYRVVVENRQLKNRLAAASGIDQILLGDSAAMREMRDLLLRLAPTSADVLVTGETGTGKELVARCLHTFGKRAGNFVAVNCAAIPENLFESELFGHEAGAFTGAGKQRIGKIEHANNGTLFLDEIEAMPLSLQAKVLRVLQEREVERLGNNKAIPVNFRVVAATKVSLDELSHKGLFRSDLYYRINVATVQIPSLRDRLGDILGLFGVFLEQGSLRYQMALPRVTVEEQQVLLSYHWPGNVRELRSCADRLVLGLPIMVDGKGAANPHQTLQQAVDLVERSLIEQALRRHGGSVKEACTDLSLTSATMYRKMKALGVDVSEYRSAGSVEQPD
jgi:DNA-binding NtrC family response regulator